MMANEWQNDPERVARVNQEFAKAVETLNRSNEHLMKPTALAGIPAKEWFFDRLESYLDFRSQGPEAEARAVTELLQACDGVCRMADRVGDKMHRRWMVEAINHDFSQKEWGRTGYKLNEGARLIAQTLRQQAT